MIQNAIIIHGPGRAGTSLFNSILSLHSELGYLSSYVNAFPEFPVLSVLNTALKNRSFEKLCRRIPKLPRSSEGYNFWLHFIPGWANGRGLNDTSDETLKSIEKTLVDILNYQGKTRIILKLTTLSRAEILNKLFSNPTILYIDRDPRAVIYSYYKQKWKYKSRPQKLEIMDEEAQIQFYIDMYKRNIEEKNKLKSNFNLVQCHYEKLIESPQEFFKNVCHQSGIDYSISFEKLISSWSIMKNKNDSWKEKLSEVQINLIESQLSDYILDLEYEI